MTARQLVSSSSAPGLVRAGLHLAALSSFAIAWQLLSPVGRSLTFFVEHSAQSLDLLLLAVGLILVPPAAMVLMEGLAGIASRRLREGLHLVFVGGLVALIAWQAFEEARVSWSLVAVGSASLLAGLTAGLLYWRFEAVRTYATFLSVAPVVVLALFLLAEPVRILGFGDKGPGPVPGTTARAPAVMIILDELPVSSLMDERGRIDPVRYPNFAQVASNATWYRNAATVSDFTEMAVPAILTGKAPRNNRVAVASQHPDNLFRLLAGSHRLAVFEWATWLCTEPSCPRQAGRSRVERLRSMLSGMRDIPVLPSPLRQRLVNLIGPSPGAGREDLRDLPDTTSFRADVAWPQPDRLAAFVESLRSRRDPGLHYLHLLLPHWRWSLLPSGQRYYHGRTAWDAGYAGRGWTDRRTATIAYQRHLLQLAAVDRMLGLVVRRLKQIGVYDRAVVVLTADHGISFRPGARSRIVRPENVADVANVPLIVKAPRQRGGVIDDSYVQTIDILPTMARHLDLRIPWRTDGRPAATGDRSPRMLTVRRTLGGKVTVRQATLPGLRDDVVHHKAETFRSRGHLFALGGHPHLIGRSVERLSRKAPGSIRATVDRPERLESVDLQATDVPAEVSGLIEGDPPGQRAIAIAINGRVAATAWTLQSPEGEYYVALCDPSAFRSGRNRVEVFALGHGAPPQLTPLTSPGVS